MIYSVHGKLIAKEPAMAVVECGGVGYACRTTLHTLGRWEISVKPFCCIRP